MAVLKSFWRDKKGNYAAVINLGQTEILVREDRTIPPGILVPPKELAEKTLDEIKQLLRNAPVPPEEIPDMIMKILLVNKIL